MFLAYPQRITDNVAYIVIDEGGALSLRNHVHIGLYHGVSASTLSVIFFYVITVLPYYVTVSFSVHVCVA